jgi:hypothetical protein
MIFDENTFKNFDLAVALVKKKLDLGYSATSLTIQQKINVERIAQEIGAKRNKLLNNLEIHQQSIIKKLNTISTDRSVSVLKSVSNEKLNYLVNKTEETNAIKFHLAQKRVSYKSDFELFQKLNYCEVYRSLETVHLPPQFEHIIHFYALSFVKNFIYDHKSRELKLLDKKFNTIRRIPVKANYHCIQYEATQSRIVCNFSNPLKNRTYISVFDYDLNLIKSRLISSQEVTMIHIGQNYVYYTCPLANKYIILDLDLNVHDTISFELIGFIFSVADDKILKYYLNKELTILCRKNLNLIRSIPLIGSCFGESENKQQQNNFKVCNIFFDKISNFFVISKSTTVNNLYSFEYYDLNGNLKRKRFLRGAFEQMFFKVFDERIYYYDERKLISVY